MNSQWKLVPVEPTETMVINGFESVPDECFTDEEVWEQYQEMSGCQQAAFRAKLCWAAMIGSAPSVPTDGQIEVVAVINEEGEIFKEAVVEHRPGIDMLPVGTELVDIAHVIRLTAERDALQLRLNAADQLIDELTPPVSPDPITWGAPKTVRQLIQQLQTLDQDLRPLSMLRVPGNVFEDGKERTRAVHLSFSHERVDGQWLASFKGDGEKVLAFWCRTEKDAALSFEFEHPSSKEKRTVTLTKRDVFDGMEDYFYDKLGEQICQCESVGETNVVDCNCGDYVHDFEIVKACLDSQPR